ncbi:hypothetical protein MJ608_06915 [Comamonas thiooxydans]|nr:hypothetical protein [Comamonas thiooxydans]UUE95364.1 hypothetical protein MJ608_06915 [Comamonas thiooxydans]
MFIEALTVAAIRASFFSGLLFTMRALRFKTSLDEEKDFRIQGSLVVCCSHFQFPAQSVFMKPQHILVGCTAS